MTERPKVGRYELLEEVGKGGMGVVYRGFDPVIGRPVALKTILTGVVRGSEHYAELHRRLEREARAAGALSHPNIVTVYDVGEWRGTFFIAMEFVDGTPLDRVVKSGKAPPVEQVLAVVRQIAQALDYAHGQGVIHRDIKPANVLVLPDGRVKIADFGIARLAEGSITQENGKVGSPSYMSPEQIEGEELDGRSDFFSLGVVFYQLLTGKKPFRGKNLPAITHAICHHEPEPPSKVNGRIPRRLDRIVTRLLAKGPENRYRNGAELCEDLALLAQLDLSGVQLDYRAEPPREDTGRDRSTPSPTPRPRSIDVVFRNITSDARNFAVGERTNPRRRAAGGQGGETWLFAAAGALAVVAGVAAFFLLR